MTRYDAAVLAMAEAGGDPHRLIGAFERLGFDVVAQSAPVRFGAAAAAVRRAVDAHSPLGVFRPTEIADWLDKNHGSMPCRQVYNLLAYLVRRGEIKHLSRGVYELHRNTTGAPR